MKVLPVEAQRPDWHHVSAVWTSLPPSDLVWCLCHKQQIPEHLQFHLMCLWLHGVGAAGDSLESELKM